MGKRLRTNTIVDQQLNPRPKGDTKLKHDPIEDDPLSIVINSVYKREFIAGQDLTRENWLAVVLRVDSFRASQVVVKARIPELDVVLPEPPEWVPPTVESCSHFLIDAHRTFKGSLDSQPRIGEIIKVTVQTDLSLEKEGEVITSMGVFTTPGSMKSSEIKQSSKKSVEDPSKEQQIGDFNITNPAEDIGGGTRNDASQVLVPNLGSVG